MGEAVAPTVEFLRTQLKTNIDGFRLRRAASKSKAFFIRMAVVVFGALTTLLLGLKSNPLLSMHEPLLSGAALFLSAAIPIFSAWDAFYDHRWLWVRYTAAQQALYGILDDLEYGLAQGEISRDQMDDFYKRFRAVLQETNSAWTDKRTKMETDDGKK
jgi:hypothetical protein